MKKSVILLFFLFISVAIQAQKSDLVWHTDIEAATRLSVSENKPLLLFFTGSDWCGWCIRLQREVLLTAEFEKWAKENVVLVELDFPKHKELDEKTKAQNNGLQQLFQVQGFPTVWFVKASKIETKTNIQQLGKTGYLAGGPLVWIETANKMIEKK